MTAGRPRRWTVQADLESVVNAYFQQYDDAQGNECNPKAKKAPNIYGLCRFCQMSYDVFWDYEKGDYDTETEKFSDTLKDARLRILEYAGEHVYTHTAGAVFNQVNLTRTSAMPWKNAQHNEVTGPNNGPLSIQITQNQAGIA